MNLFNYNDLNILQNNGDVSFERRIGDSSPRKDAGFDIEYECPRMNK